MAGWVSLFPYMSETSWSTWGGNLPFTGLPFTGYESGTYLGLETGNVDISDPVFDGLPPYPWTVRIVAEVTVSGAVSGNLAVYPHGEGEESLFPVVSGGTTVISKSDIEMRDIDCRTFIDATYLSGIIGNFSIDISSYDIWVEDVPPLPEAVEMTNGEVITGLNGDWWNPLYFSIEIPENTDSISFDAPIGNGESPGQIYVRAGEKPTHREYDVRSYNAGARHCEILSPAAGTYFFALLPDTRDDEISDATITVSYISSSDPDPDPEPEITWLYDGDYAYSDAGSGEVPLYYVFEIPPRTTDIAMSVGNATGAQLYLRYRELPTEENYDAATSGEDQYKYLDYLRPGDYLLPGTYYAAVLSPPETPAYGEIFVSLGLTIEPEPPVERNDKILGYIFNTGAMSADSTPFQQLVTFDGPTRYPVRDSCIGKQGLYVLSHEQGGGEGYRDYAVHTLPLPGGTTNLPYSNAKKQTYTWKSKKYVMPGRTTWAAAKVVMDKGCVRMRLYVDGCCKYDKVVTTCAPFRLTDQLVGHTLEIELIGQAVIHEVHVASTIEELINGRG